jgi:hypothetical protein
MVERLISGRSRALKEKWPDPQACEALKSCAHITIVATERNNSGKFEVWLEGYSGNVFISRQPLLDAARLLIDFGCDPTAIIGKRRPRSNKDDIFAPLHVAARLTVDEARTAFAKWRPFPRATVSALSDQNGLKVTTPPRQSKTHQRIHRRETGRGGKSQEGTRKNSENV